MKLLVQNGKVIGITESNFTHTFARKDPTLPVNELPIDKTVSDRIHNKHDILHANFLKVVNGQVVVPKDSDIPKFDTIETE